jgi:hypothetical protein
MTGQNPKSSSAALSLERIVLRLRNKLPGFATLSLADQEAIARKVQRSPIVIAYIVSFLAAFIALALFWPALLDFINLGWKSAAAVALVVFVVLFYSTSFLQAQIAKKLVYAIRSA